MNALARNLQALATRFPEVARRVQAARSEPVRALSREDARRIAARWLSGRRVRPGALLAVSGFSDGEHVRALLQAAPARTSVFVAESSAGRLRTHLERSVVDDVLLDPRLFLGVGAVDDPFLGVLPGALAVELTDIEPWVFAPAYNEAPDYYARFFTEFARFVDFRRKLEGTRIADAALWQANSFANLRELADAPELPALGGVFRGRPMVLVSAGPSLDESLDFLREASRVAVIVTVNSSYRAVRHAGIIPHLVLAADPREFTARGFAGVPIDGTWLVTTPIVHPEVVRLFRGRTFIWSGANELFLELRRRLGMTDGIRNVEQGTVSASAIDLGIIMGCDRICLVGQDLAIRPDGRSHAADSFYTDLNANRAEVDECRRLPGNTLPEVLVEAKLYVYLKTFEQLAAHRPQARFCNTSRLGARIEGIPYVPLDQALAWLGKKSTGGAMEALEKRHRTGEAYALGFGRTRAVLASTQDFAREVLKRALRAAALFEAFSEEKVVQDDPGAAARFQPAFTAAAEVRRFAAEHPGDYAILEGGRTRLELHRARSQELNLPGTLPETIRRLVAEREYAWAMAEGAWVLLNQLDRVLAEAASEPVPAKTS